MATRARIKMKQVAPLCALKAKAGGRWNKQVFRDCMRAGLADPFKRRR